MKSTFVFLLPIILPGIGALFEDIRVEPIFIPEGICQKPKENDYVTLSYAWKLDDVNGRFAMQLHMGNSKHPELEKIVKDMCKFQKNIAKIPARVRLKFTVDYRFKTPSVTNFSIILEKAHLKENS